MSRHLDELEYFRAIFVQVPGMATAPVAPVENGYDPRDPKPWLLVMLPGGDITIGWRRSVISIRCPSYVRIGQLIQDDVTKDRDLIHAHGEAKAVEYLKVIADKMRHTVAPERGAR